MRPDGGAGNERRALVKRHWGWIAALAAMVVIAWLVATAVVWSLGYQD